MANVTVWFDGSCPLCTREIALLRRLDWRGSISFVDVASDEAGCPIDRTVLLQRFHAREAGRPMVSGAAAFAAMWRAIPLLRPFGLIARNPWLLRQLDQMYGRFLRIRPALVTRLFGRR